MSSKVRRSGGLVRPRKQYGPDENSGKAVPPGKLKPGISQLSNQKLQNRPKSTADSSKSRSGSARTDSTTNAGEHVLESTLESTNRALATYKHRICSLMQDNANLQQQVHDQEKDALEVMGALRTKLEARDQELFTLRNINEQNQMAMEEEKVAMQAHYNKKIQELNEIVLDKESTIRLMEEDVNSAKEFKKMRAGMMKEIDAQASQLIEQENLYKEAMVRMERKLLEEKVRLQKETNARISELGIKAHQDAVSSLDQATKDMYRENDRLLAALNDHMASAIHLARRNEKLTLQNTQLEQDRETNDLIVREKIVAAQSQAQTIAELQAKVVSLEQTLSQVVSEFYEQKQILHNKASKQLSDIKIIAAQLKLNLDYKSQEMEHIKKLSLHLISQRSEVETFFMDALDQVRREIAHERGAERKRKIDHYTHLARKSLLHPRGPFLPQVPASVRDPVTKPLDARTLKTAQDADPIHISDLSWTDKERILRVLFARMNGIIKDDSPSPTISDRDAKIKEELTKPFPSANTGPVPGNQPDTTLFSIQNQSQVPPAQP